MKKWLAAAVVLAALVAFVIWYFSSKTSHSVTFRTEPVARGDLVPTIGATGTIEPQDAIDVGAQVAGLITSFGTDADGKTIDYGSKVEANMVLARIDDTLYQADEETAEAGVMQAKAGVTRAEADLEEANAKLEQAQSDWDRARKLGIGDALSESDFNNYKAVFDTAKATVSVDKALIDQAKASVAQANAQLTRTQKNLGYCTITSPVKGVIIDRRVNVGQTVVSSLNAPSLFLIAKDLTQMPVWVSVNEADVVNVHPDQQVKFTVDAYPGEEFDGTVIKVRLNAAMTQNVVTYTVEVRTDNSSMRLVPYMSANVQFEIVHRRNVLLAPNAALRWYPDPSMVAPEVRQKFIDSANADSSGPPPASDKGEPATRPHAAPGPHASHAVVYLLDGKFVKPVRVTVGATDGVSTEISSDEIHEGDALVEGVEQSQSGDSGTTNPFTPNFGRRRR